MAIVIQTAQRSLLTNPVTGQEFLCDGTRQNQGAPDWVADHDHFKLLMSDFMAEVVRRDSDPRPVFSTAPALSNQHDAPPADADSTDLANVGRVDMATTPGGTQRMGIPREPGQTSEEAAAQHPLNPLATPGAGGLIPGTTTTDAQGNILPSDAAADKAARQAKALADAEKATAEANNAAAGAPVESAAQADRAARQAKAEADAAQAKADAERTSDNPEDGQSLAAKDKAARQAQQAKGNA